MEIDRAIELALESVRHQLGLNKEHDWAEVRGGQEHAKAIGLVCSELRRLRSELEKYRNERILKVSDMLPNDHIMGFHPHPDDSKGIIVGCSCGGKWSVFSADPTRRGDAVKRSMDNHLHSVGLKPTEVL